KLAIAVIRASSKDPAPDPVLFLQGGAGSPLTARAARIATHEAAVLAPDRDLILVDPRGVGRSEPALCSDLPAIKLRLVAQTLDPPAFADAWCDSYRACRRSLPKRPHARSEQALTWSNFRTSATTSRNSRGAEPNLSPGSYSTRETGWTRPAPP